MKVISATPVKFCRPCAARAIQRSRRYCRWYSPRGNHTWLWASSSLILKTTSLGRNQYFSNFGKDAGDSQRRCASSDSPMAKTYETRPSVTAGMKAKMRLNQQFDTDQHHVLRSSPPLAGSHTAETVFLPGLANAKPRELANVDANAKPGYHNSPAIPIKLNARMMTTRPGG